MVFDRLLRATRDLSQKVLFPERITFERIFGENSIIIHIKIFPSLRLFKLRVSNRSRIFHIENSLNSQINNKVFKQIQSF